MMVVMEDVGVRLLVGLGKWREAFVNGVGFIWCVLWFVSELLMLTEWREITCH